MAEIVYVPGPTKPPHNCTSELRELDLRATHAIRGSVARCSCKKMWYLADLIDTPNGPLGTWFSGTGPYWGGK